MNVSSSITPIKGERLTDIQPKILWMDIDWKKAEKHVNRLQARITRAVKQKSKDQMPRNQTAARYRKGYEMLERYEGKLSRTVLR